MSYSVHRRPQRLHARWAHAGLLLVLLAAPLPRPALALDHCQAEPAPGRPMIGLALGGGGARGFAHLGVLKYLEEHRIPYHRIAGTSMGSIAGGLAATGLSADEISAIVEDIDWVDVFSDSTERQDLPMRRKADDIIGLYGPKLGVGEGSTTLPAGVVAGQKILFLFESLVAERTLADDFDELSVPFRAVATDLVTGDMVILAEGSLANAMRASMSVPGAFDPVRIDERLLVDGGLVRNLPVDIVRDLGADVVIAVDVGTPLRGADDINNAFEVVEQMTSLAITANTRVQVASLADGDVLIEPRLGDDITSASFERYTDAFGLGYAAALDVAEQLAPYAIPEAEYAAWKRSGRNCVGEAPVVQFVRLDNRSRFSDEVIRGLIHVPVGEVLDTEQLDRDLRQIYGLGFIRLASYRVVEEDDRHGVEISVQQDSRGTDFIETGLSVAGSGRGSVIALQAGYLKTDLDDRGSEFRVVGTVGDDVGLLTDVYKYLDDGQRWFVNPFAAGSRRDLLIYENSQALANARVTEVGIGINVGRELGRFAVLRAGVLRSAGDAAIAIGQPQPKVDFDAGEFIIGGLWDRLDDYYLPTRGARARLDYVRSDDLLGADEEFDQVLISAFGSKTWGRHNLLGFGAYKATVDGTAPVYALFTGGGFLNMSGFEPNELVGQNFGVLGLGYRFEALQSGFLPGYVGTTVEYGNAADDRGDLFSKGLWNGSVYFAYDTPIGPMYVGYGWNELSRGLWFLRLGAVIGNNSVSRR